MSNLFNSSSGSEFFERLRNDASRRVNNEINTTIRNSVSGAIEGTITDPLSPTRARNTLNSLTNRFIADGPVSELFNRAKNGKLGRIVEPFRLDLSGLGPTGSSNPANYQQITQLTAKKFKSPTADGSVGSGAGIDEEVLFNNVQVSEILSDSILPVPTEINFETPIEWSADELGVLGAAVSQIDTNRSFEENLKNLTSEESLRKYGNRALSNLTREASQAATNGAGLFKAFEARRGQITNPRESIFFDGVKHRAFDLTWNIAPMNENQVRNVMQFLKVIHYLALPNPTSDGSYLQYPSLFEVKIKDVTSRGPSDLTVLDRGLCAVTNIQCNYTPDGIWASYVGGNPVRLELTMSFLEIELPLKRNVERMFSNVE